MLFTIYLIAPAGSLRHSLYILLTTLKSGGQLHEFDSIDAALAQPSAAAPGLLVLDATTPGGDSVERVARLHLHWPLTRIVVLADGGEQASTNLPHPHITLVTTGTAAPRLRALLNDQLRAMRDDV